ncbi:hypothetical protein COR50_00005 [Chitinophaga caeni]|uniref:TonB-dependent receptor plug domain-containing protein n=1 Tax=Chitinophaga caeni TaxID=2029983 RepID=A0A291R0A2_9BACT|nr:TonB-dependent receptor [Chitinophaga caeni]ATL49666.1 hypothetical protein COR50_00005 [Chitinophaga caeni]
MNSHLENTLPVTFEVKDATIKEVLDLLVKGQPITYEIKDKVVILKRKQADATTIAGVAVQDLPGTVKDVNGTPLPGVTIRIKNTSKGTQTDVDGKFNLPVNKGDVLMISYIGYESQEITVADQVELNIRMKQTNSALSGVVVIGYGAVAQKNVTGAIAKVEAKDLDASVASTFQQTLQGKAAGVQVTQATGQPGAGVTVKIRSNPSFANAGVLYVIDGIPVNDAAGQPSMDGGVGSKYAVGGVDKSPLNFINPNDIESIQFLKDASAASIYGARAGAGVVLITTKRGAAGKPNLQYSGTYGLQKVDKMYPVFNAKEYMMQRNLLREEKWYRDNKIAPYYGSVDASTVDPYTPVYSPDEIAQADASSKSATDAIIRNGLTQQHNISLSGGNGKTRYFASGNYFDQRGVIIGTDYKRYNGRLNIDQEISDKINVGANIVLSNSQANNTITGGSFENGGIITAAIYWAPNVPLQEEDGSYPLSPYYPTIPNPLSYGTITDLTKSNRILSSAYGEWKIVDGLKARANFSYDQSSSKRNTYFPKTFLYGQQANGSAGIYESESQSKMYEYTLNYTKQFSAKHSLNAVAGYTYQQTEWSGFNAGNQNFLSDALLYYALQSGQSDRPTVGSNKSETTWASYFARAIYTYNGNITLQASIRRDGSSIFAENKKWGYFPAVSAGWVLSDEPWLRPVNTISFLKLRAGYGETGNSSIGSAAFALYGSSLNAYFGTGSLSSGLALSRAANPNLTWETAGEINLGLDFGLFKNRLSGSVDYFNKTIRNLISEVPYPTGFIISGVYANAGKTRSTGYEIALTSKNIQSYKEGGFEWSTTINFSHYLNYWLERSEESKKVLAKYEYESGKKALFSPIFGYKSDGLYKGEYGDGKAIPQMPGMIPGGIIIRDIHGYDSDGNLVAPDGMISEADRTYIGNNDPKFIFGIGNTFKYKGLDLNIFLSGMKQQKISPYASGRAQESTMDAFGFNAMPVSASRWSVYNTSGNFPTSLYDATYSGYQGGSDYWLVDATFLRARNITLGYTLPNKLIAKQQLFSSFRISFDAQNLFTITNYPGLDPELNAGNFYPLVKSFVFGVNATF